MNPIEFIRGIQNPKQFVMNMMKQNTNPMLNNLMQMGQNGNTKGVENFARDLFKQQNRDFDKEYAEFLKQIKG